MVNILPKIIPPGSSVTEIGARSPQFCGLLALLTNIYHNAGPRGGTQLARSTDEDKPQVLADRGQAAGCPAGSI